MSSTVAPDFEDGDTYVKWVEQYEGLTEISDIKVEIVDSIHYLRSMFGEDWPRREWQHGHPLLSWLLGISRWQRLWLISFTKTLRKLKAQGFGPELVKRLANSDQYPGAESEVVFAGLIMDLGAEVHPPKDLSKSEKKYDLQTILQGKEIFVEVSNLRESSEEKWAMQTFDKILKHGFSMSAKYPEIQVGGKIYRVLSEPHLKIVKAKISEAFERAAQEKVVKIRNEGVFDLDVFQQSERIKDPSLRGNWEGPNFQPSGSARIVQKIRTEANQLPREKPGFIALYDKNLALWNVGTELPLHVPAEVCEEVYNHPQLAGVSIIQSFQGINYQKGVEKHDEYSVLRWTSYELLNQEAILIANRFGVNVSLANSLYESMVNRAIS